MLYTAYVKTYVERDVRDLAQVGDEVKFIQFMTVAVSCTGWIGEVKKRGCIKMRFLRISIQPLTISPVF